MIQDRVSEAPACAVGAAARTRVAYFAHDVNHADVHRRMRMLAHGGADVRLLGFHRGPAAGTPCVDLGRTDDAKLIQRAFSVVKALIGLPRWVRELDGVDVVMARNLEMLVVAAAARRFGARDARLIYECLDVHRLMSGKGPVSRALRTLERFLLAGVDDLMVSSPGFIREHFARHGSPLPRPILVENKVGVNEALPPRGEIVLPPGPPWRIGWFGIIRCRRSLDLLIEAVRRNPGLLEVIIAGRAAEDVVGDVAAQTAGVTGVSYLGAFAREAELARLYHSAHFAWLVDFYEAGANSDWLLPNRLYRSLYYGAVPIALSSVESGRWLARHDVGVRLESVSAERLAAKLATFGPAEYLAERVKLDGVPTNDLVDTRDDCRRLVAQLAGHRSTSRAADLATVIA